jgi:AcrR family transcriptional regulator
VARNREVVLTAALEVLSHEPEASMRAIADASGLGRTTVYRHFPNRDRLVRALFEQVFEQSVAAVESVLGEASAPRDVFPRIAGEMLAIADRFRFLAAHQDIADEVRQQPRADPLLTWIEDAVASGALRPLGAAWIHGMVIALLMAAMDEVGQRRESVAAATTKLGDTLVAAFAV